MKTIDRDVLAKYNAGIEKNRLREGLGLIEFERTKEILRELLPPAPAVIYDIGGGYGEYSYYLTALGYEVFLYDISEKNIEMSFDLGKKCKLSLKCAEVADARSIDRPDMSADAILLFGPLYHIVEAEERALCLKECHRLLKHGGILFTAAITRYVPAKLFVRKHYAGVYKCTQCGKGDTAEDIESQHFVKAICPKPMIPHSFCSPELLAHIAYEKYAMGTPLHRQAGDLSAKGVQISTATLANWIIYAAREWLKPLYDEMREALLRHEVIHADETVVQVLNEPGKKAKTESRMWVYCAGEIGCRDNILFEYQPTRNGDHAQKFLGDFAGHLVTDGFSGYDKLKGVTHHGCWAHLRRKFVEALPTDKELAKSSASAKAIEYIDRLFKIERECEKDEDRQEKRDKEARKIIE